MTMMVLVVAVAMARLGIRWCRHAQQYHTGKECKHELLHG
jgi:hypothetical protein